MGNVDASVELVVLFARFVSCRQNFMHATLTLGIFFKSDSITESRSSSIARPSSMIPASTFQHKYENLTATAKKNYRWKFDSDEADIHWRKDRGIQKLIPCLISI